MVGSRTIRRSRSWGVGIAVCLPFLVSYSAVAEESPLQPRRLASKVSGHIHPAIAISKKGVIVVMFSQSDFKDLRFTRSTDGGDTWSEPKPFPPSAKQSIYPGSLTTLADGRLVHAWNVWYQNADDKKSRFVQYSTSDDDGANWSEPKSLAKNPKAESIIRHSFIEMSADRWIASLSDRTIQLNPNTGEEIPLGEQKHGLLPIVRTTRKTLISGAALRSTDDGKTWSKVTPFPKVTDNGWRFDMTALSNGWVLTHEVVGPGVGGNYWQYAVSQDDGKTWPTEGSYVFYNPGRPIGGRACPKTIEINREAIGTIYYDVDATQSGGPGLFFIRVPISRLIPKK